MPPKKRAACNPRKTRLAFLESPRQGSVHEYGTAPPKADPKCVPTKPVDQDTSTSWVSPQFSQTVELNFPARRRLRHTSNNSTVQSRARDASQSRPRAPGRKQSVCKFPSLSFTSQAPAELVQTQSFCARRPKPSVLPRAPAPRSPLQDLPCSKTLSPPDIQTPETSRLQSKLLSPGAGEVLTPVSRRHGELCDVTDLSVENSPGPVLAEDTPEHEYGVRITWRRRQELMKYLKSRGRLESSQIQVKP
ncbi:RAD9, HUS1, RAD1-interacting nuclear orphan protein 1 [Pseudophryne corroboree]|uniref:RAD9, HUS1, RAD1-interacting nuclear orphan protein 1 n=1 Tax=Pseudophryne corroboree TaxID=495146 RepID=UPI0030820611